MGHAYRFKADRTPDPPIDALSSAAMVVDELGSDRGRLLSDAQIVAPRIVDLFWYPGGLAALGLIAYLLAPKAQPREPS